jgi:hypothetical protein
MNENFDEIKNSIKTLIDLKLLPVIKNKLNDHHEFINKCRIEITQLQKVVDSASYSSRSESISKVIGINENLKQLIALYFEKHNYQNIKELFPDFINALEQYISETPESIIEVQDPERFQKKSDDPFFIKLLKPFKRFFLKVSNLPISISNFFRKIFKKAVTENKVWQRKVLLRNLRLECLYINLNSKLLESVREIYKQKSLTTFKLWNIYESIDKALNQYLFADSKNAETHLDKINLEAELKELQNELILFEEKLAGEINSLLTPLMKEYQEKYLKAGTVEYPARKLKNSVLEKKSKQFNKLFSFTSGGWENNFMALGDDWQMNNEFYIIGYKLNLHLDNYKAQFRENIKENFFPHSAKIISFIEENKKLLVESKSKSDLISDYNNIKLRIKENLTNKLIPGIIHVLHNQNLVDVVAEYDNFLQNQLDGIKNKRLLVKNEKYDVEVKDSDINTFSPREILEYSAAPKFFSKTNELKIIINTNLQQIQNELSEIDHIEDFTIDSAINKLETDDNAEESRTIAVEGIDRALNKLAEIENKFDNLLSNFDEYLQSATDQFTLDLRNLTQTEKIFDIRLNLTKAIALQKSKQVRKQIVENIKNVIPQLIELFKKLLKKVKNQYQKTQEFFKLAPSSTIVASEVSDYLAETKSAILKLPFVYQRLFEVKPLEDERFFFERESELKTLSKAYSNWQKEKYAPVIIVGEKGSGATSLINKFLSDYKSRIQIFRYSVVQPVSDQNELLKIISEILNADNLNSIDDVVNYLNNLPDKKIIIFENLQRLFVRKVDGFAALKIFFEIISRTNKNIFWLSTCTLYSWIYLNKTIHILDHFGYVVELKKLNEQQITELVSKRHRVSGYKIEYVPDENTLKSKSFKKIPEEERQAYLRKKYFSDLNKFAQSNITLALIYWLRSAREIVNDVIKIGPPPELDYSFLENLSNDKMFALAVLLIHDGLRIEDHSKMFNVTLSHSRLLFLLMSDDGILVNQSDVYIINPLLYRQIVRVLKSKNILH